MNYRMLVRAIGKTLLTTITCAAVIAAAIGVGYLLTRYVNITMVVIIFGTFAVSIFASIRNNYRRLKGKL